MNTPLTFKKMHGLGNDFIMMNGEDLPTLDISVLQELAKGVCNRFKGIGADGLIVTAPPSDTAQFDIRFIYINSDGSIAEMCGNGIRCFARFINDEGILSQPSLRCETGAGLIQTHLQPDGQIKVNMGAPIVDPAAVPFSPKQNYTPLKEAAYLDHNGGLHIWPISMGNPHAILFLDDPNAGDLDFAKDGAAIETHAQFPAKTNVEFTTQIDPQTYNVIVWERGCGFTQACGTGACATAVAAISSGRADADKPVSVQLPGGTLKIEWAGNATDSVWMTGPAEVTCTGTLDARFESVFG